MANDGNFEERKTNNRSLVLELERISHHQKPKESIALYLSAFGASFVVIGVGIHMVWMSPVIGQLKSNNTDINPLTEPVTTFQVSLMAGLGPLGGLISLLCLLRLCDIIGRKKILMLLSVLMFFATMCLAFSTNIYMFCLSRFIIGLSLGAGMPSLSIFLTEISEDRNRGIVGCFLGLGLPLGNLYTYLLGSLFSVKMFTLLCAIPNVINLLCFLSFIPESPFFLAMRGDKKGTIEALKKVRNKNDDEIETEYQLIVETIKETSSRKSSSWGILLKVRSLRKGFIIAIALSALQHLTGIPAILVFAGPLFDASGTSLSGDMTAILIGSVKVICVIFTTGIIERAGRRPLLLISTLGGCIPNMLLGLFFYLKHVQSPLIEYIEWLPVSSVLLAIVTYSLGLGVIPSVIMTELFPSNLKSKTSLICTLLQIALISVVTTLFPIASDSLGTYWCLWIFGVFSLFGFLFVYVYFPEIKGKSLTEVQRILSQ